MAFAYRAARVLALLACTAGAFSDIAVAQAGRRSEVARVERQRAQAAAEATRLQRQARAARSEIDALAARLVEAGRRRAAAEQAAAAAEDQLAELKQRQDTDAAIYAQDRRSLEDLLIAAAFAERTPSRAGVRAGIFARALAPSVTLRLAERGRDLADARLLAAEIETQKTALAEAQRIIDLERRDTERLITQRRTIYASLNADAASAQARAERLGREARSLRELASRVVQPRPSARASAAATAPANANVILPASWLAPVSGRIVRPFGAREGAGPPAQGAGLAARPGAQVIAPAAAQVAYAGVFRSYGQVLILNLDNGYALVLTGMETLRARSGESVAAGQPVGDMSSAATPAPVLYVEVRRDGRPINPTRWLTTRGATLAQID